MTAATISSKGWIVIPSELRKKYGLDAGKQVMVVDYGGVLALVPALDDPVAQAQGMLTGGPSLTGALLRDRAEELAREA
ncbi:MAG TPA: AbrB/MazE/SpoVT family DNA-binding domain-containing protein [Anaerolineae bacterium]|nr:AbrB/MazE/SpoVT family DNA-binding domain-containing protein [Anaerolineae bacterium]HNU05605.1 AbrB/MazE/SpoVT family DNA-binding domain-containing protein [Anaerolineae bacterium]